VFESWTFIFSRDVYWNVKRLTRRLLKRQSDVVRSEGIPAMPEGLSRWNPIWDQSRAESGKDYVYQDDQVHIATDFECGSGEHIRAEGDGYALDVEPEPGDHE